MENKTMLENLIKKKNDELKKMKELDEVWFNEKIDFDTSIKIRNECNEHRKKYNFYKNMIEKIKKGEKNDK